mgnify:CR=1 FL=1
MKQCPICGKKSNRRDLVCSRCCLSYRKLLVKTKLINYLGGKCSNNQCEIVDIRCLEFHHVDPIDKEFEICNKIGHYGYDRLLEEVKKCKLLCSNCHRKFHHKDKQDILDYFSKPRITNVEEKEYKTNYKIRKVERPPKEVLAKEVFKYTSKELAKKYGVSDVSIHKWCKWYNITKPSRGYWSQQKTNHATYG